MSQSHSPSRHTRKSSKESIYSAMAKLSARLAQGISAVPQNVLTKSYLQYRTQVASNLLKSTNDPAFCVQFVVLALKRAAELAQADRTKSKRLRKKTEVNRLIQNMAGNSGLMISRLLSGIDDLTDRQKIEKEEADESAGSIRKEFQISLMAAPEPKKRTVDVDKTARAYMKAAARKYSDPSSKIGPKILPDLVPLLSMADGSVLSDITRCGESKE